MYDVVLKQLFVALNYVFHEQQRLGLTQSRTLLTIQIGLKITILTILEKQIEILSAFEIIVQLDDVG